MVAVFLWKYKNVKREVSSKLQEVNTIYSQQNYYNFKNTIINETLCKAIRIQNHTRKKTTNNLCILSENIA